MRVLWHLWKVARAWEPVPSVMLSAPPNPQVLCLPPQTQPAPLASERWPSCGSPSLLPHLHQQARFLPILPSWVRAPLLSEL